MQYQLENHSKIIFYKISILSLLKMKSPSKKLIKIMILKGALLWYAYHGEII